MDWSGCEFVKVAAGAPVITGSRVYADSLVSDIRSGFTFEQILDNHPTIARDVMLGVLSYGLERLGWDDKTLVDWSGCSLVEQVPGRCSGAPTVVGTRIFPDTIAEYYWSGSSIDEIREDFPSLSKEKIAGLIDYVKSRELSVA